MGQYYVPVVMDKKGNVINYSLQSKLFRVTKDYSLYNGNKLMEHSWVGSSFTDFLSKLIYKNPLCVCWVGDYSNTEFAKSMAYERNPDFRISQEQYDDFYHSVWGENVIYEDFPASKRHFNYRKKFLVNHTKKCYFSLTPFANKKDEWIIYPISLLACLGCFQGGGDYREEYPDAHLIGTWAFDIISIEDEIPEGYMLDNAPVFKEKKEEY